MSEKDFAMKQVDVIRIPEELIQKILFVRGEDMHAVVEHVTPGGNVILARRVLVDENYGNRRWSWDIYINPGD